MVLVPADVKAASRLCAGDFDWGDAPRGWVTATRELAAVLLTDWRDLGLAS